MTEKTYRAALTTGDTIIVKTADGQLITADVTEATLTYIYCGVHRFSVMTGEDRRSGNKMYLPCEKVNGQTYGELLASQAN